MNVYELGVPDRTYFELFLGEHPSDKLYSVQVKDWNWFVEREYNTPSKLTDSDGNPVKIREASEVPAVILTDVSQTLKTKADHLCVEPTEALAEFLFARGIKVPEVVYVQPLAFNWLRDGDFEVEDVTVPTTPETKNSNNSSKSKSLIAIAIALVSLLS